MSDIRTPDNQRMPIYGNKKNDRYLDRISSVLKTRWPPYSSGYQNLVIGQNGRLITELVRLSDTDCSSVKFMIFFRFESAKGPS